MGFAVGESIGPYKITQYIGQGGMATIYRAYQPALDRDVALKVIHPALKEDQAFLARLRREAAIVARLNHPNIVDVYDYAIAETDGTPYIVMRYIEGKTLKDVVQERKLSPQEILNIIRPVADALAYAHAHGVLHRDVKLSNIMLDHEGNVFLTDFGLARLTYKGESTLSHDMLIGSPQYISPEMAKGDPIDARTDVYSLGVVLFEMFAGRLPFQAETPYATVMAHINDPVPNARQFNKNIPPAVDFVLQRALAKKPEQRFGSVDELMRALENAVRGPSEVSDARAAPRAIPRAAGQRGGPLRNAPPKPKSSNRPFVAIVGTLGALALGAICLLFVFFFGIQPTLQGSLSTTRTVAPATNNLNELASPTRSSFPTITGDASAQATLTPTRRAVIPATRGKIAYSVVTGDRNEAHVIWIADGDGENAHAVIDSASWPALSPDGTKIAYYQLRENGIYTANLDGSARKRVIGFSDVCCVQWSPDSKRIVFFRGNLKIGGKIYTADADGGNISEITTGFNPAWSPDSLRLAFSGCLPNTSVCGILVYDFKTQTLATITRDNGSNPQWSPRGDKIIYQGDDGKGHINVFIVNSDGTNAKQLTNGKSNDGQPVFSRDGNAIYWRSDQNGTAWAIYVMNADGSIPRVLIKNVPVDDLWGRESLSTGP